MPARLDPITDMRSTLSVYRYGRADPTTRLTDIDFWRATHTPDGPGTVHVWWSLNNVDVETWGPGSGWLADRVSSMTGADDAGWSCNDNAHPAVRAAHRNHRGLRIGASGTLYHELLPVVLAQRVTSAEAVRQWRQICLALGTPAPGPDESLRLPPAPEAILARPAWWYHPFGIECKRAEALRMVARYAHRIDEWAELTPIEVASKLALLRGIGPWTIGSALGPALGDPDSVPVGDYHIPNAIAAALAGEPRGNDARMLELLAPYAGQRGRVIRLLGLDGHSAPAFGPRRRIEPMYRR